MILQRLLFPVILVLFVACNFGKNANELYSSGVEELKAGKPQNAHKLFKAASKKDPENTLYLFASASTAPNQNDAYLYYKSAWDKGLKNPQMLSNLSKVAFRATSEQKLEYALSLYNELPDSTKTVELKGDIHFQFGKFDSALAIWKSIPQSGNKGYLIIKIALAYEKMGNLDTELNYLEESERKGLLDSRGYMMLMSLYAIQYRYSRIDSLYIAAAAHNAFDNPFRIDYSYLLLAQNKFQAAVDLLTTVISSEKNDIIISYNAKIILSYIFALQGNKDELTKLFSSVADTSVFGKAEKKYLELLLSSETDTANRLRRIESLYKSSPIHPILTLSYALQLSREKKYPNADSLFRRLPKPVLLSPSIITEYALVLVRLGKDDDALKYLDNLHRNRVFTKLSLELFRDLTLKKNLIEKSDAAQKMLEQKFKNDVGVQWSAALMALKKGNTDSALSILSSLNSKYPDEEQFEIMRINALYISGDYNAVLNACKGSNASPPIIRTLEARAFRKLDMQDSARKAYETALSSAVKANDEIYLEYATFLNDIGDLNKASDVYTRLLDNYNKQNRKDSLYLAVLLNNFAWTGIQSGKSETKLAIDAVKRASALQPDNPRILDTYATVLLKAGSYKECITLLEKKHFIDKEPGLLVHLGEAFEKTGNENKAVRAYQTALSLTEHISNADLPISRSSLIERVQLLQKKPD